MITPQPRSLYVPVPHRPPPRTSREHVALKKPPNGPRLRPRRDGPLHTRGMIFVTIPAGDRQCLQARMAQLEGAMCLYARVARFIYGGVFFYNVVPNRPSNRAITHEPVL